MSDEIKETIQRFYEATGTTTVAELAEALMVKRQAVYSAMKSNKIPWEWYFKASKKENYSTDWLYHGNGPKHFEFHEAGPKQEEQKVEEPPLPTNKTLQDAHFEEYEKKRSEVDLYDTLISYLEESNNGLVHNIKKFANNLDV